MSSASVPNAALPSLLTPGWLTADSTGPQRSGRIAVTADDTDQLPNPQVPVSDGVIDTYAAPGAGPVGEGWVPTTDFPWPVTPSNGDGIVAVVPGATGNSNDNDDPSGLPGWDGPQLSYGGAYTDTVQQGGNDAVAQQTTAWGFNVMQPGSNMGYQRNDTRMMGNDSPGYINVWNPIRNVTPAVKTANQFTQQPLTDMAGNAGTLPPYGNLSLANSGGPAYYVNGPEAPQTDEASPAQYQAPDPAAGWA